MQCHRVSGALRGQESFSSKEYSALASLKVIRQGIDMIMQYIFSRLDSDAISLNLSTYPSSPSSWLFHLSFIETLIAHMLLAMGSRLTTYDSGNCSPSPLECKFLQGKVTFILTFVSLDPETVPEFIKCC